MPRYEPNRKKPVQMPPMAPGSFLDYLFNWGPEYDAAGNLVDAGFLQDGETGETYLITVDAGITLNQQVDGPTWCRAWLTNPQTVDKDYNVSCQITTNSDPPRVSTRTMRIPVRNL